MGVSNKDGNTSESDQILQKNKHTDRKSEIQDVIMKVMTKLFSAKVVLERLPDSFEHKNETIKEESFEPDEPNYDSILSQTDTHKNSDKLSDIFANGNIIVKEEILESDEINSDADSVTARKTRNWKSVYMAHMIKKICPKHCNDEFKGKKSITHCQKCKRLCIYQCKKCNKTLTSYTGIMHHVSVKCNFQGFYYQCPDCTFQSVFRNTVACHVKKLHSNKQVNSIKKISHEDYQKGLRKFMHKCAKCGQGFRNRARLITHGRLYCDKLEYAIDRSTEIKTTGTEDGSDIRDTLLAKEMCVLYCSTCNKETDFKDDVTNKCSNCNRTLLIKCSKCEQTYQKVNSIIRHLRLKCATQKNYKCSNCNYTNAIPMLVLDHYKNVHNPTSVECSRCGGILKNRRTLSVHKTYCKKEANLICNFPNCSFKTNSPVSLRTHKKRHFQKDDCDCPKCGKTFNNQVTMKGHLFSCGKPASFQCDDCSYASKQKRDLQTHILRMHLRDINKDYDVCPKCQVVLKSRKSSRGHLRFCGTSQPHHKCNFCYFMTHKKYCLQVHVAKFHPENIENNKSRRKR